ncbi:Putative oxidoreductase, aldo/keto reductase family protein [Zea mays]|uniref:Putative oxidoreductase, aldo/keto reductase family protein n=1 Tax=Zea mays TaxID=4577 RepID=A0A1D6FZF8_MAIZE|nr:Putative oxidoreductase, aldo/keto reductase family protein [Zea mays]
MDTQARPVPPRVKLGIQGFEVSKLGFGCMGLTGAYNSPLDDEAGIAVIAHAFSRGVTLFDTSDVYGPLTNEILLGKALKQLPREQVQVATKFGIRHDESGTRTVCGRPEYVRACCEASLRRLGIDCIDLYYQHRIDTTTPIEETVSGACLHIRELGIGIVPYSPLGRGFFGGRGVKEQVSAESNLVSSIDTVYLRISFLSFVAKKTFLGLHQNLFLSSLTDFTLACQHGIPRFAPENLEKNKQIYLRMEELANKHQCSPAQLALAWVLHQGDDVVPIPGTTKIKNLDSNIDSLKVKLTDEDLKEMGSQIREEDVAGGRQFTSFAHTTWKYADTPKKQS